MKKLILHLMCAVLVISSFLPQTSALASQEPTIAIADEVCNPGDEISVSVSLENNPGFMYLSATPKIYDAEGEETEYLKVESVENGEYFSIVEGKNLVFTADSDVTDNGTLCTLNISISEDAPFGDYSVELLLRECYNSLEEDVEFEALAGAVTVEKPHTPSAPEKENVIPAKCGVKGSYDEVIYCVDCGEELSRVSKEIPALQHKLTTLKAVAPTCKKTGLTEGKKCSLCGTVTKKQQTVAKKAHSYKTTVTKATASKNGKSVKKCSVCDYVSSTTTIYAAKTIKLSKTEFVYTGSTIKPTLVIKDSKGKTISSSYYTVSGTRSTKNIGSYKIKITFKGNYSGDKTLSYTVEPKNVTSLALKSSKKKELTVSWKKDSSVSGYEVLYATNSKFTSGKKTVTIKSANTNKTTIKKLSSKKTYYVKVRSYKTVSGKKYYSAYTSYKKLKIK